MIGYDSFKHRKKVHVAVDEEAKPIDLKLSPGNTHDSKVFKELYGKVNLRDCMLTQRMIPMK